VDETLRTVLPTEEADAWLFWDARLPLAKVEVLEALLQQQNDVFHAGLLLGSAGQPGLIDYVSPTWMLNRDPDAAIEATSWRLSLRACLIRTEVLRQLGGPLPGFETLEAASLEMGYRYIRNGVFLRHCPQLLAHLLADAAFSLPAADQLKFITAGFGKKWLYWAAFRALANHTFTPGILLKALKGASHFAPRRQVTPYVHQQVEQEIPPPSPGVSVLIPTVNRYPYLRTVLSQLRQQTVKPLEIIIIDQTPPGSRDLKLAAEIEDLPVRWFEMGSAGQCSSRNLGIQEAKGEYIFLIDDDIELQAGTIKQHLDSIQNNQTHISNGIVNESVSPRNDLQKIFNKMTDVFPGGNTMIKKNVLTVCGLFDLAYDHGQRADHDLGMRIYLAGQKMVIDPRISVFHHHAPQGGLREHKARVTTRTASRKSLIARVLPSPSDIYLSKRYFTRHQVREMLWISVFETFTYDGPAWRKIVKLVISLVALPGTLSHLKSNIKSADELLQRFPQIPRLPE
jgi:glycosyltransferase involved in cell wall biosynthesis